MKYNPKREECPRPGTRPRIGTFTFRLFQRNACRGETSTKRDKRPATSSAECSSALLKNPVVKECSREKLVLRAVAATTRIFRGRRSQPPGNASHRSYAVHVNACDDFLCFALLSFSFFLLSLCKPSAHRRRAASAEQSTRARHAIATVSSARYRIDLLRFSFSRNGQEVALALVDDERLRKRISSCEFLGLATIQLPPHDGALRRERSPLRPQSR